jgi:hypothetical protein
MTSARHVPIITKYQRLRRTRPAYQVSRGRKRGPRPGSRPATDGAPAMVEVTLHVHGKQSVNELAAALSDLDYVDAVLASDANAIDE